MLRVRARVGVSQIHGLGLFAMEPIRKGQTVWEMRQGFDLCFSLNDLATLSDAAREQVLHYCDGDVDPLTGQLVMSGDDARFTNHSEDPNTVSAEGGRITVAARDILPAEEITWQYYSDASRMQLESLSAVVDSARYEQR